VRNVVIRGAYVPALSAGSASPLAAGATGELLAAVARGAIAADALLSRYATLVYHQAGSYEETARRIGLDRRTVRARIDREFLAKLKRDADAD
jgi:DNA-directed RNA polymerase specialized sigma24 family protein